MSAPIIIGVDPAEPRGAREALVMGDVLADALRTPLQAVHVYVPHGDGLLAERSDKQQEIVQLLSEARVAGEATALPGVSPARVLHHLADLEHAACVVIGSGHDAARGRTSLGQVGETLLHGSRVPVVVTPRGYRPPNGGLMQIAVAYGGTPESDEAMRRAAGLAGPTGFTVLAAEEPAPGSLTPTAHERLDHALASATSPAGGLAIEGDAAEGLAACSAGLDLLIAGSRSYGPLRVVLLGAVTRRLLSKARCPVMLVPRLPDAAHDVALVGGMDVALER